VIIRDFGECQEVAGPQYSLSLYTLAESVKAKSILEVGMGWGWSGRAFALSLENRPPAKLTSIDIVPERVKRENRRAVIDAGIEWNIIAEDSSEVEIDEEFDLIYIDANPNMAHADFLKFYPHLRPGGLMIMDGYGWQLGPTEAVDSLSPQYPFVSIPYGNSASSHAVYRKPVPPNGKYANRVMCKECNTLVNCASWKEADKTANAHTMLSGHCAAVTVESRDINYVVIPK